MRSTRCRPVDNETPSGALDGTNVVFTLAFPPLAGSVHLFKRGLRMTPGADNDYTIAGRTITFKGGADSGAGRLPRRGLPDQPGCRKRPSLTRTLRPLKRSCPPISSTSHG